MKYIKGKKFYEPSVSSGSLVDMCCEHGGICVGGSDIQPLGVWDSPENYKDGLSLTEEDLNGAEIILTNPVYKKEWLLPLLDHWTSLRPTWLLLPLNMCSNKYFAPYMKKCSNMINCGRLYFFENTWVSDHQFQYDEIDKKWDPQVKYFNLQTGVKHYEGYLTPSGQPTKAKFIRGVDDYCWYCFNRDDVSATIYETAGS